MPVMRRVLHLEDSTSSSNVSGLMSRYRSDEDIDDVAPIHPATRATVYSNSKVHSSTPLPGAKVNLAMVGSWPSPVRADPPYSLRQNLHNEMKQMKGKKVQDSLEVKQSPLRKKIISLSELMMSSDEESEESHHSTLLHMTDDEVNDADPLEVVVRTRSQFRQTECVLVGNEKRMPSVLTEHKLEKIHNTRERNDVRKSPKKIQTADWKDDISNAKKSGQVLRNQQFKLPRETLNKKEVTFHLPNKSPSEEQVVSRRNVERNPVRSNIYENKGRRKKTSDKNQVLVHAEVHSEDTAEDESDVTTNGDPIQHTGSKKLQGHEKVTRKQKKMSPKEIPQISPRSRRRIGTDKEDDPIQDSSGKTLKNHESVTKKQKKTSPKEISQNSLRSRRKSGTDNEGVVRRSKRKRVRRLEYWRGERIEYKVGMDNCREVVGISAGNPEFAEYRHRHKAKQKHVITDLLDREEDFERKLIPLSGGNNAQMWECFSTFRIESETGESDMPVLTGLEAPGMSAGIMSVEPSTVLRDLVNDESNLVCFIMSGTVTVTIKKSERTLKKYQIFSVPKGVLYSISNMSQNGAIIGYTMYE